MGGACIGVDLGGTKVFGALVSPDGSLDQETYLEHAGATVTGAFRNGPAPRASLRDPSEEERAAGPAYAALVEVIKRLLETARGRGQSVTGVAIGAPGTCRPDGTVILAGALGWRDVPLGRLLERRLGLPCAIENDVNLAALGECAFGAARGAKSAFVLAVGTGIGGAVVLEGRLWRGARLAAGEIGTMIPARELLGRDGRDWGALEAIASGTGIADEARAEAARRGIALTDEAARAESVVAAAEAGEAWARDVVERTLDHWALAVAAVEAILDPEVVVLAGGATRGIRDLVPRLEARLATAVPVLPRLVPSTLGYRAAILGAPVLLGAAAPA